MTPVFNTTRSVTPLKNIDTFTLGYTITNDPILERRTEAVRTAADPGPLKLRLPGTCLAGAFKPLPAHYDHGKCRGECSHAGYRNTQHIDWDARTGVVLIDIDDIAPPASPDVVKVLLRHTAPAVSIAWTSARGKGLKVGVAVSPVPADTPSSHSAWIAAKAYMAGILTPAGLTEGVEYKIDPTPAASQLAILAHDTAPIARVVDPGVAITWTPTTERIWQPAQALIPAHNTTGLAEQLDWRPGYRSHSMFTLGLSTAHHGHTYQQSRANALAIAGESGLLRDYGQETALRHFDRGYQYGADQLLDFGLNPAP